MSLSKKELLEKLEELYKEYKDEYDKYRNSFHNGMCLGLDLAMQEVEKLKDE